MDNFVFIGDSLTFGYGVPKSQSWFSLLKENCKYNLINKGINGNTSTDILFRFTEDVINNNPKKVFILCGTNDLLSNKPVENIISNIILMITESLENKITPIIGIPPIIIPDIAYKLFCPTDTYKYCYANLIILREALLSTCDDLNINFVDLYTLTSNNINTNIFLDGIHLNSPGNILVANYLKTIVS